MNDSMSKFYGNYMGICLDLELEILKLLNKDYKKIILNKNINRKYGVYLRDIRRNKVYYLDDKLEDILSKVFLISSFLS